MKLNLANKLTLSRFVFSIIFVVLFYLDGDIYRILALILFVVAAVTDFVDGYVARSFNQITELGKLMDPLADKVLVFSALVLFCERGLVPGWLVILILSRDLMIGIFRAVAAQKGEVIAADKIGKLKTVVQMVSTVIMLTGYAFLNQTLLETGLYGLYAALALTLISGYNYIYKNRHIILD